MKKQTLIYMAKLDKLQYSASLPKDYPRSDLQRSREGVLHGYKMEGVRGVCAHILRNVQVKTNYYLDFSL